MSNLRSVQLRGSKMNNLRSVQLRVLKNEQSTLRATPCFKNEQSTLRVTPCFKNEQSTLRATPCFKKMSTPRFVITIGNPPYFRGKKPVRGVQTSKIQNRAEVGSHSDRRPKAAPDTKKDAIRLCPPAYNWVSAADH